MNTNRLELTGTVLRPPKRATGINGVPHGYFVMEHRSMQQEAGLNRPVYCKIQVVVSGREAQPLLDSLDSGQPIRVAGFLAWQQSRNGQSRLVLHADSIEPIS
ncbi:primosomal replication protein N [Ferrimonas sediminicola]|uniref:Replication restart protein PriB n=1 Tax=Ferrimonas sediminicola TaxID=2569538 RepID=A0A4V5NXJ9_9GAMM|nr:primosomal replication protein N [Ferrimonas sediminicola]TKB51391.1 primosomal replication protein N [Ferrimonas sediminicola]